jgi:arsenite/tail-anchored protein-transporting ATPase
LSTTRLIVVAGKGGVGKTTVTAVLARAAADLGLRVLIVDLDGKPTLASLVPGLEHLSLTAPDALAEYLETHGLKRLAKRLASSGVIDVVSTAAPGIDDIVVLGKLKQLERSGDHDLILVDGPAAGHAITFLMSARSLLDTVSGGPVRTQAAEVLELLGDPQRCQVVLVTLPETTPVNELVETAYELEERVGITLGPVVVNSVDWGELLVIDERTDPVLTAAAEFRNGRRAMHRRELARLDEQLALRQIRLPMLSGSGITPADVEALARTLGPPRTDSPAAT